VVCICTDVPVPENIKNVKQVNRGEA
jgi:hypothetical protein